MLMGLPAQNAGNGKLHESGHVQDVNTMDIADAVHAIKLDSGPGLQDARAGEEDEEGKLDDSRLFVASVFPVAPNSALAAPEKQRRKGGHRSASAEPSHRSIRQAA
jgi:hypothetical protein